MFMLYVVSILSRFIHFISNSSLMATAILSHFISPPLFPFQLLIFFKYLLHLSRDENFSVMSLC
jgi:hypothetical protein